MQKKKGRKVRKDSTVGALLTMLSAAGLQIDFLTPQYLLVDRRALDSLLQSVIMIEREGGGVCADIPRAASMIVEEFVKRGWLIPVDVEGGQLPSAEVLAGWLQL